MHPNAYLRAFWRNETIDQIFVAMSFAGRFKERFDRVFKPAIEEREIAGRRLQAFRVDNSKTGDSILTEIVAGIAHSRTVLADVSVIGDDTEGRAVRNGNVMYEVGIALACRLPSEVLLVRDDDTKDFLFDVSSIPHTTIDFSDTSTAIDSLRARLADRLQETELTQDARIQIAVRGLTQNEHRVLKAFANLPPDQMLDIATPVLGGLSNPNERGVSGLLLKGCIRAQAIHATQGSFFYTTTPFGYTLARAADALLPTVDPGEVPPPG
jgi:hypothetical protein